MQKSDGVYGRLPITTLPQGRNASAQADYSNIISTSSTRLSVPRPLAPGFRCSGRWMLAARAASVGLRCGLAARGPTGLPTMLAAFSTQSPTVPKPGFAPGVPPPPGQPPASAPSAKAAAATPTSSGGSASAASGAVAAPPPGQGGRVVAEVPDGFPQPAPGATGKSRWSVFGWAIPILGLPLLAAYYNYQKEFDKEWDEKLAAYVKEIWAMRQAAQQRQAQAPAPAPPSAPLQPEARKPPPPPPPAPEPAAPPPPPATPAPSLAPAPVPEVPAKPASPAAPAPAPAPVSPASAPLNAAPEGKPAAPAAAPATASAPAPEATDAAAVILVAAEAAAGEEEAVGSALPDLVTPAAVVVEAAEVDLPAAPPAAQEGVSAPAAAAPAAAVVAATAGIAVAEAAALAMLQTGGVPSSPLPEGLPEGSLGLEGQDLSPLGLVRHAVTSAGAGVADWSQWPERFAQAVADSKLVFEALAAAAKWHEQRLKEVRDELETEKQRTAELQAAGTAAVARFKEYLRRYTESTKELMELEVRQAEKRTRLEVEKERLAETRQRGEALEQLRLALAALGLAHESRVRQAAAAQGGHAVAAGAAAVAAAAESGAPLRQAAAALGGVAAADPVVAAVVGALPEEAVASRSQLVHQFRSLRRDLSALSHLPGQSAGIVAVAVARVAAWLKADESKAVKVLGPEHGPGGIDAALARTESLLAAGQLASAAEELQAAVEGTAAAALASGWVEAARRRAAAEAAVAALNAHAAATWASLA